ncbi:hypothetical protein AtDm6_0201 [Acetobacter tropicalis]|uniref:Uncharacterized protein n=1 Tax=Acetobacter tropicalis TaxID=104102 RepID=A0A094YYI1_9PROT|nr:hypothetical protein AtDm6_0201 [Acetobacter tropicalis]
MLLHAPNEDTSAAPHASGHHWSNAAIGTPGDDRHENLRPPHEAVQPR